MPAVFIIYGIVILGSLIIFFSSLRQLSAKKKLIGEIEYTWCSKLNYSQPLNWIILFVVLAYLFESVYLVAAAPYNNNDYSLLIFFFLFLSFVPFWIISVGENGIIVGTRVYLWKNLEGYELKDKGKNKYLELRYTVESGTSKTKLKRIPIPGRYSKSFSKAVPCNR